jgi:hypothetical protein
MDSSQFPTSRQKAVEAYLKAGLQFEATTVPYHSTQSLKFEVVEDDKAPGAPSGGVAFMVARAGQVLRFFSYGKNDSIDLGGSANTKATEAETNLVKGSSTNGAQDFVIEGVGLSMRGLRVENEATNSLDGEGAAITDKDVVAASTGDRPIYDPGAIWIPPQLQSPFNLEQGIFQSVLPHLSLQFGFDDRKFFKLGLADMLPQAGAQSFLRANGVPDSANRYDIEEGFIWRKDGTPDSEFQATLTLERAVVIPINLVTFGSETATVLTPQNVWIEILMRLFGLSLTLPSEN